MSTRKTVAVAEENVVEAFEEGEAPALARAEDVWASSSNDVIESALLEGKARLIGVPFAIVKVFYRTGAYKRPNEVFPADFVSVEGYTAPRTNRLYNPETILRLRKRARDSLTGAQITKIGFDEEDYAGPGDLVVINDSSTGVYRQITAYLAHKGYIKPRFPKDVEPAYEDLKGSLGQNVFDQGRDEWLEGKELATAGISLPNALVARQGLRVSGYENDSTQEGATFYLA